MTPRVEDRDILIRILRTSESRVITSQVMNALSYEYVARTSDVIRKSQEAIRRSDEILKRISTISR